MHKDNMVENIVYAGLCEGWAYNNILNQIRYAIATKREADILFICGENSIPKLTKKAEKLYKEYEEEYYKTI